MNPKSTTYTTSTYYASLHIAGDINVAKAFVQKRLLNEGGCYQFTECDYVYSGGCEKGMVIRAIQYPRFVKPEMEILNSMISLARDLSVELGQKSYTIETSTHTMYVARDDK